jgi:hypothetical protein
MLFFIKKFYVIFKYDSLPHNTSPALVGKLILIWLDNWYGPDPLTGCRLLLIDFEEQDSILDWYIRFLTNILKIL